MTFPDEIRYRRLFPWLHLFDAIRLALSFRQLTVAVLAVTALWLGEAVMEQLVPHTHPAGSIAFGDIGQMLGPASRDRIWTGDVSLAARPWNDLLRFSMAFLSPDQSMAGRLKAAGLCVWSIAVWSFFGLVLCRLTARRFARDEQGSVRQGIRFGLTRWTNAVVAPLLPAGAATLVMLPVVLALFAGNLPWVGHAVVVVSSPFVVLGSLAAAYLVVAALVGWPLMVAAIATDDCDGFGGLSRSYSLWTGRPWYFTGCWIVAAAAGSVAMWLAAWLGQGTFLLIRLAFQAAMVEGPIAHYAGSVLEFQVVLLLRSYGLSLFWAFATIVYMILRQSVDGLPLDNLAPDDDERPVRDPLPVVGMPAMSQADGTFQ